jgi:hypothetical protein
VPEISTTSLAAANPDVLGGRFGLKLICTVWLLLAVPSSSDTVVAFGVFEFVSGGIVA